MAARAAAAWVAAARVEAAWVAAARVAEVAAAWVAEARVLDATVDWNFPAPVETGNSRPVGRVAGLESCRAESRNSTCPHSASYL